MRKPTPVSVSQARRELAELLRRVRDSSELFVIQQRGTPMAVLLGMEESQAYQSYRATSDDGIMDFSLSSSRFGLIAMGASARSDVSEHVDELLAEAYLAEADGP